MILNKKKYLISETLSSIQYFFLSKVRGRVKDQILKTEVGPFVPLSSFILVSELSCVAKLVQYICRVDRVHCGCAQERSNYKGRFHSKLHFGGQKH